MALHKPFKVKLKKIVDLHTLQLITRSFDFTYMGQIYKALYLVAFFSFLRISNLLPHSTQSFSPIHQLSQVDLIFAPPGLHIIIKWTKTLQTRDKVKILKLPSLGSNPLCPVLALKNVLSLVPKGKNLPVFQVKTGLKWLSLTDTKARRHFSNLLQKKLALKILPSHYTHSVVQVQLVPSTPMSPYTRFNPMAPGPRSVCGNTSPRTTRLPVKWLLHFRNPYTSLPLPSWGLGSSHFNK